MDAFADINDAVNNAEDATQESPQPLTRELPPGEPYPVDALGTMLGGAVNAIVERVMVPPALAAQSVIAAATLAVQAHADVLMPFGEHQNKPLSNYFISIAPSGERKTTSDKEANRATKAHESDLMDKYQDAMPDYLDAKAADEAARNYALKHNKGNFSLIRKALAAIGLPPLPPLNPLKTCEEPNYEGLVQQFNVGQASLGLFSTEGGAFFGGHGMRDNTILRTATGLSDFWDGETVTRVRAAGSIILRGRRLASHLMVQPNVAALVFGNELLVGQGLTSRFLTVAPESRIGTRIQSDQEVAPSKELRAYDAHLYAILSEQPRMKPGERNVLDPRQLPLDRVAVTEWRNFANHIEAKCGKGGELETVRAFAAKLAEHAARLAGVLTMVSDLEANGIGLEQMQAGIELAEHYLGEALRIEAGNRLTGDMKLAADLLAWLQKRPPEPDGRRLVALIDVYQKGPVAIREKATATRIIGILESHKWLVRITGGAVVGGTKRRDVWSLVAT